MTLQIFESFFLWCTIINFILFFISFIMIASMKKFIIKMHGKWYDISEDKFNLVFYNCMLFYKVAIIFFNLVPYIAIKIIS
jgi:uncharacterized protein DUF6868